MPATFTLGQRPTKWERVELNDGGDFEVELRGPTFEAQLSDWEESVNHRRRIEECVVGWRGVNDGEGEAVPFSQDNFAALCEAYPEALNRVLVLCRDLYNGIRPEKSAKPPSGSTAAEK